GNEFELEVRRGWRFWSLIVAAVSLTGVGLGWLITYPSNWHPHSQREAILAVVERIIGIESDGDPNAKNKRSSATGLGQFLDATCRTKGEKIIKANPFLEGFTVADLRNWADRKMRVPRL